MSHGRRLPLALRLAGMLAACAVLLTPAGCGRRGLHRVSGSVRFADGAPLTRGRVVADYGHDSVAGAWGHIRSDGSFTIGTLADDDGMRAGSVRVAIVNAVETTYGRDDAAVATKPLVHPRFMHPETSGISFDVPRQTRWDIIVEGP